MDRESNGDSKGPTVKKGLAIACSIACCAAQAAPVHLDCTISSWDRKSKIRHSILLDEESQIADFSESGMGVRRFVLPARFMQTDIRFYWYHPALKVGIDYRIDRKTLGFSRIIRDSQYRDHGICKTADAVERNP
jgi:hypothetical protein